MASRVSDTFRGLQRSPAAIAIVVGAVSSVLAEAILSNHWIILAIVIPVGLGFVVAREWREAGLLRRDLLPGLLELEAQGRELVVKLAAGDGNAPAPALTWSREASQWFRQAGFVGVANMLDATIEPGQKDYGSKAIWNRKAEVERRAQAVVERVMLELQNLRTRIEARISQR